MMTSLLTYAQHQFLAETTVLSELREFALEHQYHYKLTQPLQTQFICFLLATMNAHRVIEVGTFLGYTTLAMAQVLPENGEVVTCEHNESWLNMGRPFWEKAGVDHKISICHGDAAVSLQCLLDEGQAGTFDFIYIDAEKRDYKRYLELSLQLISPTGVLAFDNILRVHHGDVVTAQTPATRALAEFNRHIVARKDLQLTMLPMYDGLLLVRHLA